MPSPDNFIAQLSPHLFWDVDRSQLTLEKNAPYIVSRVLEYGRLEDFLRLKKKMGLDQMVQVAMKLRTLDDISLNFIATLTDTPRENFRCYNTKQYYP